MALVKDAEPSGRGAPEAEAELEPVTRPLPQPVSALCLLNPESWVQILLAFTELPRALECLAVAQRREGDRLCPPRAVLAGEAETPGGSELTWRFCPSLIKALRRERGQWGGGSQEGFLKGRCVQVRVEECSRCAGTACAEG